jgi:hypothetical protein
MKQNQAAMENIPVPRGSVLYRFYCTSLKVLEQDFPLTIQRDKLVA